MTFISNQKQNRDDSGIGPAIRQSIRIKWVKMSLIQEHIVNKKIGVNA
ncbi:MAG: hypothetical protein ACOVS5_02285 [Oligoflexus sp.]